MRLFGLLLLFTAAACTCDSRRCTPTNCGGCCTSDDVCNQTPSASQCGLQGVDCRDCGLAPCNVGVCAAAVGCTGTSCPPDRVCDFLKQQCVPRPTCFLDGGCPKDLRCVKELKVCATHCASGSDCPASAKTCTENVCRCSSDARCSSEVTDGGALSCDPLGKLCVGS